MKKSLILLGACGCMMFAANSAFAQETVVVEEEQVVDVAVPCHTYYYSTSRDNWFIQLGAGMDVTLMENHFPQGSDGRPITAAYGVGFGKWMSPYLGWRLAFQGGAIHFKNFDYNKYRYVSANFDFMWDMFNSFKVNPKRVFSIVPFIGIGGTYAWDYRGSHYNIYHKLGNERNGEIKRSQWLLPVSAGIQLRFRLSSVVDFFAEGRAQFYGDNFNNTAWGEPVDINFTVMGGLSFNIGGSDFNSYNPCDYVGYINSLNNQVNDLRGALATTAAALAAAEAQLPCPEVVQPTGQVQNVLLSSVRFKINSAEIEPMEGVNVYNTAQWLKDNPDQNVTICGYADKDTGTSEYNMALSKRRAEAVRDQLVNKYGINPDRLSIKAEGSNVQPYGTNDWNRIVIFSDK